MKKYWKNVPARCGNEVRQSDVNLEAAHRRRSRHGVAEDRLLPHRVHPKHGVGAPEAARVPAEDLLVQRVPELSEAFLHIEAYRRGAVKVRREAVDVAAHRVAALRNPPHSNDRHLSLRGPHMGLSACRVAPQRLAFIVLGVEPLKSCARFVWGGVGG